MCMDIPAQSLLDRLDIDYEEEWWPNCGPPFSWRGIHIEEIADACLSFGYAITSFSKTPHLLHPYNDDVKSIPTKIHNHLDSVGVFIGRTHAVAWDGKKIYDPNYKIYDIDQFDYNLFYVVTRVIPS